MQTLSIERGHIDGEACGYRGEDHRDSLWVGPKKVFGRLVGYYDRMDSSDYGKSPKQNEK